MPTEPTWEDTTDTLEIPKWEETSVELPEVPPKTLEIEPGYKGPWSGGPFSPYQAEKMQEAADLFASLQEPPIAIPRIEAETATGKLLAAPVNVASGLINATASPVGLALLPLGASRLGAPVVKGIFGGLAAKTAGEQLGTASVTKDPGQIAEGLLNAGLAGAIGLHRSLPDKELIRPAFTGEVLRTPEGALPPPEGTVFLPKAEPKKKIISPEEKPTQTPEQEIVEAQKMILYGTPAEQALGMERLRVLRMGQEREFTPVNPPIGAEKSTGFLKTAEEKLAERTEPVFEPEPKGEPDAISERSTETLPVAETPGDSEAVVGKVRQPEEPAPTQETVPGAKPVQAEVANKPIELMHGSPMTDLVELKPGSMMTSDPAWAAGYTTRTVNDFEANRMRDEFVGNIYKAKVNFEKPITVKSLHDAEAELIRLAEQIAPGKTSTLAQAAKLVNESTGIDGIVAVRDGVILGAIPLKPTKVSSKALPVDVLSKYEGYIPDNIKEALTKAQSPYPPATPEATTLKRNEIGKYFNRILEKDRSLLEGLLDNWDSVELSEDGTRLFWREMRGSGEKVRANKGDFIKWLFSDEPFNPKTFVQDPEWIADINKAREIASGKPATPEATGPKAETAELNRKRVTWQEVDGGLWMVYDKNGGKLGAIYDQGSAVAGEKPTAYDILDDWYNIEPGEKLGEAKTFREAIKKLKEIRKVTDSLYEAATGNKVPSIKEDNYFDPRFPYGKGVVHNNEVWSIAASGEETNIGTRMVWLRRGKDQKWVSIDDLSKEQPKSASAEPVAISTSKATELPALRKVDTKGDPRLAMPGITKRSKPNSLIVALRDLDSVPVKEIVLKSTGDPILDAKKAEATIQEHLGERNISLRESLAVTTGPNGRAILKFGMSPNGMTWASAKEWLDLVESRKSGTAELVNPPKEEPLYSGIPLLEGLDPLAESAVKALKKSRRTMAALAKTGNVRKWMSYTRDAGDSAAGMFAQKAANDIRGQLRRLMARGKKANPLDEEALSFVREADGDPNRLQSFRATVDASPAADPKWKAKALAAIDHGIANWAQLNQIAAKYEAITHAQLQAERASGIKTVSRRGYVMHAQDIPDVMGFLEEGTGGEFTGFKHIRTYDTFADSIAHGVDPKTLNAVDLLQARLARGQQLINNRSWVESLRTTTDPKTGNPLLTNPEIEPRGPGLPGDYKAPQGYTLEMAGGKPVAVLKGYAGIFSDITDPSRFRNNLGMGLLLKSAVGGKHVSLMLDTFHLGRVAFWESIIKPLSFHNPKLPVPSYKKGVLTLDYSVSELIRMANAGEIPATMLPDLLNAKRDIIGLVRNGLNIGRVADTLHADWVQQIPITGKFNKWLFTQFQRGAMAEVAALEVPRYRRMNPGLTDDQIYRAVAKDLNTRFGNFGRQGWFRSKTAQDMARLIALAPQWNEGLIKSELGALTGAAKGIKTLATEGRVSFGLLPRAVGTMMLAQFAANQLINYITRGKPTWENTEEGMGAKLSAWIPDVIGNGPGFFLHPFGLAAEITHLLQTKYEKTGNFRQSITDFLGGRQSTIMRPVTTFFTGRLPVGTRPIKSEDVWWETLKQAIPAPIGASAVYAAGKQIATGEKSEQFAGQLQKQVMASMGIKTDQAPSEEQRIGALAREFNKEKGITPRGMFYAGDYEELTGALRRGAMKEAQERYQQLLKKKPLQQIVQYYLEYSLHPFTRSNTSEAEFFSTLTDEQKATYQKAKQSRANLAKAFFQLLQQNANANP